MISFRIYAGPRLPCCATPSANSRMHEATGNESRPSSTARAQPRFSVLRLGGSMIWLLPRAYVPNRIAEHSGLIVLSLNGLSLTDISAGAEPRCIMLAV